MSIFALFFGSLMLAAGIALLVVLSIVLFRGIRGLVRHCARFFVGVVTDTARFIASLVLTLVYIPMSFASVCVGRWSSAMHYGRATTNELTDACAALLRVGISHPLRFLLLGEVVDAYERKLPQVLASAPAETKAGRGSSLFPGYRILGTLKPGGSGAKLYVGEPTPQKRAEIERRAPIGQGQRVVIKSFMQRDGASMPQIVRESRALEAARSLGLVLDHEISADRFFYVMHYVPGQSVSQWTQRLHTESSGQGLGPANMKRALATAAQLLHTLDRYHAAGLWHKDVKPDNIIVNETGAHLVDLGLLTPITSAMTLTTHGTEYFRDPEMVKMALRGAKVRDVEAVKFDIYGVGAVLFSIVEDSFPAHGGLSTIHKKCPEALRFIVRRAMTDLDRRYASAMEMAHDVDHVLGAEDMYAVKPFELPSMRERSENEFAQETAGGAGQPDEQKDKRSWFGPREAEPIKVAHAAPAAPGIRRPAREQLKSAQARARAARARVRKRTRGRRMASNPSTGEILSDKKAAAGIVLGLAGTIIGGGGLLLFTTMNRASSAPVTITHSDSAHHDIHIPGPVWSAPATPRRTLIVGDAGTETAAADLASLEERGFFAIDADSDIAIDAEATVRQLVGVLDPASGEARARLLAWLEAADLPIDAVAWIVRGSEEDSVEVVLVRHSDTSAPRAPQPPESSDRPDQADWPEPSEAAGSSSLSGPSIPLARRR